MWARLSSTPPCSCGKLRGPPLATPTGERGAQTLWGITLQLFGCRGEATGKGLKSLSRKWHERLRWHVQIGLNLRTAEIGRHSNVQEWRQNTPQNRPTQNSKQDSLKGFKQRWPNRSHLGTATAPKGGSEYPPRRLPHIKVYICMCSVPPQTLLLGVAASPVDHTAPDPRV